VSDQEIYATLEGVVHAPFYTIIAMEKKRKTEDDLMLLIKNLSSAEKRYFKIFSQNEASEGKAYVCLFDILNNSPSHITNAVLNKNLLEKGFKVNIVKTKQYLFNNIIKALILFDIDKDNEIAIRMKLLEARILLKKNMLETAKHKLKLLEKICVAQSKTFVLAEIYSLKKTNYTNTTNRAISSEELQNLIVTDEENTAKLVNELSLKSLFLELNHINSQEFTLNEGDLIRKCNKLLNDSRLQIDEKKQSHVGKMFYLSINGYLNLKLKKFEIAAKYFGKYINLLEENKYLLKQNQFNYISGLGNIIAAYGNLQQYEKIENILIKLKNMQFEHEKLQIMQMKSYYLHISQLYTETKRFDDLCTLYTSFNLWISINREQIEKQITLKVEYCFAIAFLVISKFKISLIIINRILSEPQIKSYMKVAISSKVVAVICHYEEGNYEVMQSVLRSLRRQLLKDNLEHTLEYLFSKSFATDIISFKENPKALYKKYLSLKYQAYFFDFRLLLK
jgi:hypothetical protein